MGNFFWGGELGFFFLGGGRLREQGENAKRAPYVKLSFETAKRAKFVGLKLFKLEPGARLGRGHQLKGISTKGKSRSQPVTTE